MLVAGVWTLATDLPVTKGRHILLAAAKLIFIFMAVPIKRLNHRRPLTSTLCLSCFVVSMSDIADIEDLHRSMTTAGSRFKSYAADHCDEIIAQRVVYSLILGSDQRCKHVPGWHNTTMDKRQQHSE